MTKKINAYEHFAKQFGEEYFGNIKPLIEQGAGAYGMAGALLKNINFSARKNQELLNSQRVEQVSSALSLLTAIEMLGNQLEEGKFNPEKDLRKLEGRFQRAEIL